MTIPTQLCSKCHEDFMNCKCEQFHPNIMPLGGDKTTYGYFLGINELKAIYRTIEHQFIPYEDREAHEVFNKIAKIVKENELARTDSSSKKRT